MKRLLTIGALGCAALLAACGGGGAGGTSGSGAVTPPTNAPQGAHRLVVTWSGAAGSANALDQLRHAQDVLTVAPITLPATYTPAPFNNAVFSGFTPQSGGAVVVKISEVDASGSPVPIASPNVVVADTTLAQVSPTPVPTASGTPGPAVVIVQGSGTQRTGNSTLSVSTTTASGSAAIKVYPTLLLDSIANRYNGSQTAVSFNASGVPQAVASCAAADVCLPSPQHGQDSPLTFPYGATAYTGGTPFADVTAAIPFTPSFTTYTLNLYPNVPADVFIFKTALGGYVALRTLYGNCSNSAPTVSSASYCDIDAMWAGLYKYAPSSGVFTN